MRDGMMESAARLARVSWRPWRGRRDGIMNGPLHTLLAQLKGPTRGKGAEQQHSTSTTYIPRCSIARRIGSDPLGMQGRQDQLAGHGSAHSIRFLDLTVLHVVLVQFTACRWGVYTTTRFFHPLNDVTCLNMDRPPRLTIHKNLRLGSETTRLELVACTAW